MSEYRKFVVAVCGALAAFVAHRYGPAASADLIAVLTAIGVYRVPND